MTNTRHPLVSPIPVNKANNNFAAHLTPQSIRTNLQLSCCYFEDELHHRADGQTSCTGWMDLIPNGIAVHLQTQTQCSIELFISHFLKGEKICNFTLFSIFGLQYFSVTVIAKLWGHLETFSLCHFTSKLVFKSGCLGTAEIVSLSLREHNREWHCEAVRHI